MAEQALQDGGVTASDLDYLRAGGRTGYQRHVTPADSERRRDRCQGGLGGLAVSRRSRDPHYEGAGVLSADTRSR